MTDDYFVWAGTIAFFGLMLFLVKYLFSKNGKVRLALRTRRRKKNEKGEALPVNFTAYKKPEEIMRKEYGECDIVVHDLGNGILEIKIISPIGQWTEKIQGERLPRILAMLEASKDKGAKGFWQLFIKSEARTQGKYRGQGR